MRKLGILDRIIKNYIFETITECEGPKVILFKFSVHLQTFFKYLLKVSFGYGQLYIPITILLSGLTLSLIMSLFEKLLRYKKINTPLCFISKCGDNYSYAYIKNEIIKERVMIEL